MKSKWIAATVLLPILVLLGWVTRLEHSRRVGSEVLFNVAAYDPRDLLAGHYLQYRVDYGMPPCDSLGSMSRQESCVCLGRPSAQTAAVASFVGECAAKPSDCGVFIRGRCDYQRLIAGIERYYIPEDYAQALTRVPEGSQIKVRVSSSGTAQVTDFLVNGKPLADYVRSQP